MRMDEVEKEKALGELNLRQQMIESADGPSFYSLISDYCDYIDSNELLFHAIDSFHKTKDKDFAVAKEKYEIFLDEWRMQTAKLLSGAKSLGTDEIDLPDLRKTHTANNLEQVRCQFYEQDLDFLYNLFFFELLPKINDSTAKQVAVDYFKDNSRLVLAGKYDEALREWNSFLQVREAKPWWWHWNIDKLYMAINDNNVATPYSDDDYWIAQQIKQEYYPYMAGRDISLKYLEKKKFLDWFRNLNNYLQTYLLTNSITGADIHLKQPEGWHLINGIQH